MNTGTLLFISRSSIDRCHHSTGGGIRLLPCMNSTSIEMKVVHKLFLNFSFKQKNIYRYIIYINRTYCIRIYRGCMHRQGLDYQQVAKAAAKIRRKGMDPSLTNVCEELGLISVTSDLSTHLEK